MYAAPSEASKELKRAVSRELWGFFSPWKQKKACCFSEKTLGCSLLSFTEPTPFHNEDCTILNKLFLKRSLSTCVKRWCSHTDKGNAKSSVKTDHINTVAISIKYTVSDVVIMSAARKETHSGAAVCTLLISHLHLYNGQWEMQLPSHQSQEGPWLNGSPIRLPRPAFSYPA